MPRRIIGDTPKVPAEQATIADERGIGCMLEVISFGFPDGKSYVCNKEKELADAVLARNRALWPAIVMFPLGLSADMIYAQCTFKYSPDTDHNYKEASGINNFLRKGRLVEFMREYNVASLLVGPQSLADSFYALDEPRIEESLFVITGAAAAIRYRAEPPKTRKSVASKPTATKNIAPGIHRGAVRSQPNRPSANHVNAKDERILSRIACPRCRASPKSTDSWQCKCGHCWNTFDTRGLCPACGYQWTETACPRCGVLSPHADWYLAGIFDSPIKRPLEDVTPPATPADQPGLIRRLFKNFFG